MFFVFFQSVSCFASCRWSAALIDCSEAMKNNNSLYSKKTTKNSGWPCIDYVLVCMILIYCIVLYFYLYIYILYTNNQVCPPPLGTTTFATVTSQLGEHSDWRGGCRTCWVVYIYIVHVCMISIYPAQMYTSTLFFITFDIFWWWLLHLHFWGSEAAKKTHALVLKS